MSEARRELIGYAGKLSIQPGEPVDFMVSSEFDEYQVEIVRLIHGDNNPDGPGLKTEAIDAAVNQKYPGRHQETHTGSCLRVDDPPDVGHGLTLQAWIWPTTPADGRIQGVISVLILGSRR